MQPEMAQLVREHGLDFLLIDALEQRIEEHDALVAADAREIGIAVRRAARSVHHEHASPGRKAAAREQRFHALAQGRVVERREAIEQRRDEARRGPRECEADAEPDEPGPQPPPRARPVHQRERREHEGRADCESQRPSLEQVEREQTRRDSVESEPRLDAKRAPQRERQAHELQKEQPQSTSNVPCQGSGQCARPTSICIAARPPPKRERELDQRLESRRPAAQALPGDRVVGGALLLGELDPAREQLGYAIAVRAHRRDLPRGEPQARRRSPRRAPRQTAR